jgi:hypothetical protein
VLTGMAAPMINGDEAVGTVTWLRGDLSRTFTYQEQEIAGLLAGRVGFSLANARRHQQTRDAAITDPLTGSTIAGTSTPRSSARTSFAGGRPQRTGGSALVPTSLPGAGRP